MSMIQVSVHELRCENLYVPGQDDEVYLVLREEVEDSPLLPNLRLFAEVHRVEGNVVDIGTRGEVQVIGDDEQRYLGVELARSQCQSRPLKQWSYLEARIAISFGV